MTVQVEAFLCMCGFNIHTYLIRFCLVLSFASVSKNGIEHIVFMSEALLETKKILSIENF